MLQQMNLPNEVQRAKYTEDPFNLVLDCQDQQINTSLNYFHNLVWINNTCSLSLKLLTMFVYFSMSMH